MTRTPGVGLTAAVAAVIALTGCTAAPDGDDLSDASQFVACLKAAGLEAQVGEFGNVLVKQQELRLEGDAGEVSRMEFDLDPDGDGAQALLSMVDEDGFVWVAPEHAAFFVDDPDAQAAYAGCEAEYPGFIQPVYSPQDDPEVREQLAEQQEDAITFARCARDAGFAWVADPEPNSGGAIILPLDLTENEFRALLTACAGEELSGVGWSVDTPTGELDSFDWFAVLDEFIDTSAD